MANADSELVGNTGALMDEYGDACEIRRSHTVKRFDSASLAFVLKTTASVAATSLVVEFSDSARMEGRLPEAITLTIAGNDYVTQADAEADSANKQITVAISPGMATEAVAGTVVTVPDYVSYVGTTESAPRYWADRVTASSPLASAGLLGSLIGTVERWSSTNEIRFGETTGDLLVDSSGTVLGRFTQRIESDVAGFEGVVS